MQEIDAPFEGIATHVAAGPDVLATLPGLAGSGHNAALLICDAGVAAAGIADRVEQALAGTVAVERFVAAGGEPTGTCIDSAAEIARALRSPLVIGLGGGTALDIAKLVAALYHEQGPVTDFAVGARALARRTPLVLIPTTAGTGSEVTRTSIFSDADGRKLWVWAQCLLPDHVLLDADLTRTMPHAVSVSTGLDAFVHALEAASGQRNDADVEALALPAIRRAATHLLAVVEEPGDLRARQGMQEAALLAGAAIDRGGTGIAHNIAHALGTCYHVPHGIAVALGLRATLAWSVAGAGERFIRVADAFADGLAVEDLADRYQDWLDRLGFAKLAADVPAESINAGELAAAMAATENAPMAGNSARPPAARELAELAGACVDVCGQYGNSARESA